MKDRLGVAGRLGATAGHDPARSALAVLRSLASLLESGLLALLDPRVTGQETGLLQQRAIDLFVDLVEGASHTDQLLLAEADALDGAASDILEAGALQDGSASSWEPLHRGLVQLIQALRALH